MLKGRSKYVLLLLPFVFIYFGVQNQLLVSMNPFQSYGIRKHWAIYSIQDNPNNWCNTLRAQHPEYGILLVLPNSIFYKMTVLFNYKCEFVYGDPSKDILKAYLYIVKRGALSIYTSVSTSNSVPPSHLLDKVSWLVGSTKEGELINPTQHFGCKTNQNPATKNQINYKLYEKLHPLILLPVSDDPDYCDKRSPAFMARKYADISIGTGLYRRSAFWALSDCLDKRNADCLVWSFLVQYLLDQIENGIGFYLEKPHQVKSDNHTVKDVGKIQDFLKSASCQDKSFLNCSISLIFTFYKKDLLSKNFAESQIRWITTLYKSNYKIRTSTIKVAKEIVMYKPVDYSNFARHKTISPINNIKMSINQFSQTCKKTGKIKTNLAVPVRQFHDILLIIVFNKAFYQNIKYLEIMHRSLFPNILYCGPEPLGKSHADYQLSFVQYPNLRGHAHGSFSYKCMIHAIKMGYNVSGYLLIGDDVLMNPKTFQNLDFKKEWYLSKTYERFITNDFSAKRSCDINKCETPLWLWARKYYRQTTKALADMQDHTKYEVLRSCYTRLVKETGGVNRNNGAVSDMYYIPKNLATEVLTVFEYFYERLVFVEMVVPTSLNCLTGLNGDSLSGFVIWLKERDKVPEYFAKMVEQNMHFIHAMKLSKVEKDFRTFFCNTMVPALISS